MYDLFKDNKYIQRTQRCVQADVPSVQNSALPVSRDVDIHLAVLGATIGMLANLPLTWLTRGAQ